MPRAFAVVVVAVFVVYVAALELAAEFVLTPPDAAHDVWYGPTPIFVGLGIAALIGVFVRHAAVAAAAFVPVAVQGALDAASYERPWHEVAPLLNPGWPLSVSIMAAVLFGLLAGRALTPQAVGHAPASRSG